MTAYDDLLAERYGRDTHAWWTTPEHTPTEDIAAGGRVDLIKATQETDELEQARERRAS